MLRLESTRLGLTSSDILDYEERASHPRYPHSRTHIRLSRGPNRQTKSSIVPQEQNVGRTRAASTSSQATICDSNGAELNHTGASPQQESCRSQMVAPIQLRGDSRGARTRQTGQTEDETIDLNSLHCALPRLSNHPRNANTVTNDPLQSHENNASDIPSALDGSSEPTRSSIDREISPLSPPPFSSARARRRYGRSQDASIFNDPLALRRYIEDRHFEQPRPSHDELERGISMLIPELVLPTHSEITRLPPGVGGLDPAAAVFVPRTRFGSTTRSANETSAGNLDLAGNSQRHHRRNLATSQSVSDLRIRHPSEQNIHQLSRGRRQPQSATQDPFHPVRHLRARTSDQNTALGLEPLNNDHRLNAVSATDRSHFSETSQFAPLPVPDRGPRTASVPSHLSGQIGTAPVASTFHTPVRAVYSVRFNGSPESNGLRAVSSTSSLVSSSSTNFSLPFYSNIDKRILHGSQVGAQRSTINHSEKVSHRPKDPRRTSCETDSTRHCPSQPSDITAKLLHMPNSPLYELTERLSRYPAIRPQSHASSGESSAKRGMKFSLLAGDPFGQDSSPIPQVSQDLPLTGVTLEDSERESTDNNIQSRETPSSSILPAPRRVATPQRSSSPSMARGIVCYESGSKPRSPLADISPTRVPFPSPRPPSTRRVWNTSTIITPRVRIYNDAQSPSTQPQTPADIQHSRQRRGRGRSETDGHEPSPPFMRQLKMCSSPPVIPPRNPHRNTYPVSADQQQEQQQRIQSSSPEIMSSPRSARGSAWRDRLHRRAEVLRSSGGESAENEMNGHVAGLEEDRRTWLERRQNGSLDTTPPKEGRFERYMS